MHRVLERQIKRFLGEGIAIPPEWKALLEAVSETYTHSDEDRALLDRSLELSSREFSENSQRLREAKEQTEEIVRQRTRELEHALADVQVQTVKTEEAKAKDEAILSSIGDGLVATDKDGVVIMVNRTFELLTQWTEGEVLGKRLVDVLPREDEAGHRTAPEDRVIMRILQGKDIVQSKDLYYVRKDGTRFAAALTPTPILLGGKIVGAVEVFRDVTKERELDRAKTDFISLASHQLRTPLSAMKWTLELMSPDGMSDKQREHLEDLRVSNERLIMLVNSLLNIARMETGKLVASKKTANIADLIHSSIRIVKPNADKKKQTVTLRMEVEPKEAQFDPVLFDEAFNNLLGNSINYAPEGSEILITVSSIEGAYRVSVHNNGPMIAAEDRQRLFTKFYRGTEARSMVTAGSGLGLYIARAAVEANGGVIGFDSSKEQGTVFYFTVPA
jgi:PAS domain S-box-containing protein